MYKVRLRGELCMGFGSLLSLAAFILLIFVHVGTTNLSSTPRGIALATMNVTNYGAALAIGFAPDPIAGLYATNASAPLARAQGIRTSYQWGFYTYCALLGTPNTTGLPSALPSGSGGGGPVGTCGNTTAGFRFTPYDVLVADMSANYSIFTSSLVPSSLPFRASSSLGTRTHTAYILALVGTILVFVATLLGLLKRTASFLLAALAASAAAILVLASAALWASAIHAARSVNVLLLSNSQTALGIEVQSGLGLTLLWAAFGCLTAALVPYWISSCTFRG